MTTWHGPIDLNGAVIDVTESDLTIAYEEKGVVQSVKYERGADR